MTALLDAGLVLLVLLASSVLGAVVRGLLSKRHRSRDVIEFVQLVVAMLVTSAALVLRLLTSSVKSSFDKTDNELSGLAIQLIQLDRSLRQWGSETEPVRELLASLHGHSDRYHMDRGAEAAGKLLPHTGADDRRLFS